MRRTLCFVLFCRAAELFSGPDKSTRRLAKDRTIAGILNPCLRGAFLWLRKVCRIRSGLKGGR